ncbi:hypothetical protein MHW47_05235 [Streptomyces sp. OfavH-34-F]|uniref:hypothetical protein n=1 Tax=Streptomyces sp. OfavH-34-F TaxID=2917760 RepID=UPI001EF1C67B|nr:hypothetical protein [Streptomyces sp. OfavH-34-F]MCG7523851.1 hypothetical protein [Streptomyces sp. OfavH-34-F]
MSKSWVHHHVLPGLRESGAVATEVVTKSVEGVRRVAGLSWELLPLTAARARHADPLALEKRDLAVLLSVCEALFGPGWAPVGKPETPPGLLAARRGRGAAAERLGLLRLVLAARPDGSVRLVGGGVKAGFDRADATVAQLVGCSMEEAARVVDGLVGQGLLEVSGRGVAGARVKVVVPAVAAAHGRFAEGLRVVREEMQEDVEPGDDGSVGQGMVCVHCASGVDAEDPANPGEGWEQPAFFLVLEGGLLDVDGAFRVQEAAEVSVAAPDCASDLGERGAEEVVDGRADGAALHADHASVVTQAGFVSASSRFSGEAVSGCSPLPGRAYEREDRSGSAPMDLVGESGGSGGPLRGELQQDLDVSRQRRQASVAGATVPLRWSLPRGLERVLSPVWSEWARIGHAGGRHRVRAAVRAELVRLGGIVGLEQAPVVLAERLERRLAAQCGQPVRDPVGWLLGRGLPQRAECYATGCDDRVRMETGLVCPSCELLIEDRRALRHQVARAVTEELPRLEPEAFRAEVEARLGREVARQAAAAAVRWEQAAGERARREEAWARRREERAAAEAELAARACTGCGVPEAGGLCLTCSQRRAARQSLEQAAQFATVAVGPVDAPGAAARLAGCLALLEAEAGQTGRRLRGEGLPEAVVAWQVRELAEQICGRERARALQVLLDGPQARVESERVALIERMRRREEPEVRAAAGEAARRCAEALLAHRLGEVRAAVQGPVRERSGGWRERMARCADLPLEGEAPVPSARVAEGSGAVSAA